MERKVPGLKRTGIQTFYDAVKGAVTSELPFRWCPVCGIGLEPGWQVVVDPGTVELQSESYPTLIKFFGQDGKQYRYALRSDIAKIYHEKPDEDVIVMTWVDSEHSGEISLDEWLAYLPVTTGYRFVFAR